MNVWIKASVTAVLLGGVAWLVPWDELWGHARSLGLGRWAAVLGVIVVAHFVGVFKWRLAVNSGRCALRSLDAVQCYCAGLFANMFLPSIIGGDALRAILAGRIVGRYEAVVFGGIADRLSDVLGLVALAIVGGLAARQAAPPWVLEVGLWAGALCAVGVVVGLVALRRVHRWPSRVRRPVLRALSAGRRLLRRPGRAVTVLVCSLAIQGTFALLNAWVGVAVGIDVPLAVWFFAFPMSKLVSLLPISIAGFGVREASLAGILVVVGVTAEQAVLVPLVWGTMLIATSLLGGGLWFVLGMRAGARTGAGHGGLLAATRRGR